MESERGLVGESFAGSLGQVIVSSDGSGETCGGEIAVSRATLRLLHDRMYAANSEDAVPGTHTYYPPYHSKYNPVEHCWGGLEKHWSGALLTDIDAVREWTKSMRWDGIAPNVYFLDKEYHTGVKLTKKEMKPYSKRLQRTPLIERWSLMIKPEKVGG